MRPLGDRKSSRVEEGQGEWGPSAKAAHMAHIEGLHAQAELMAHGPSISKAQNPFTVSRRKSRSRILKYSSPPVSLPVHGARSHAAQWAGVGMKHDQPNQPPAGSQGTAIRCKTFRIEAGHTRADGHPFQGLKTLG